MDFHSKEQLREYIHSIHDFIRNSGAGYGMTALKIFNVFYSLKLLDGNAKSFGLSDICDWKEIRKYINEPGFHEKIYDAINELRHYALNEKPVQNPLSIVIRDIYDEVSELFEDKKIKDLEKLHKKLCKELDNSRIKNNKGSLDIIYFIYHQIPDDLDRNFCVNLFNKVDKLPIGNNDTDNKSKSISFDLKGKIYEYFIGRDSTAISELGAYFTDRHITNFCMELVNPEYKDGIVSSMIDPFAGSGGFTLQYVDYIKNKYKPDWSLNNNFMNIHHYDMSEDVVKIAGVEFYSLTGHFPKKNDNFRRTNTFKEEFTNQYKYIFANPPYGGDKGSKTPDMKKRDLIIEHNKIVMDDIIKNIAKQIDITNDKELSRFTKEFEKESTFKDKLLKGDKTTKGLLEKYSEKSNSDLMIIVEKQMKPFCAKNKIDYDLNKEELYNYNLLKIQNLSLKKKNEDEVKEGLKQKVNYDTCSDFIKDYADKIIKYNANFEYIETRKALIDEIVCKLKTEKDEDKIEKLNADKDFLENEIKVGLTKQYDDVTGFNDKEACSLILLMALLEKDGTCCGVLKEGVFFDGKYSKLRCFLINNFNVTDIVSVDAKSFENTTTKTSIIVFKNNGKTKKINFHELDVKKNNNDVFEYIKDVGHDITQLKDEIKEDSEDSDGNISKGVQAKFICSATYKQLSEVKITYNKSNKPNFDLDYSLNYKNYKDYKVECPEGYELKKLEDLFEINPKSQLINNNFINYVEISDIFNNQILQSTKIDIQNIPQGAKKHPIVNDILICSVRPNKNKIVYMNNQNYDKNLIISSAIYILRCKTEILNKEMLSKFVYNYIINNLNEYFKERGDGSSYPRISPNIINEIEIPFPIDIHTLKQEPDKEENEEESDIIEYKGIDYIVIDEIMYPYNQEDGSKGEAFGTFKDGKVKKYKK